MLDILIGLLCVVGVLLLCWAIIMKPTQKIEVEKELDKRKAAVPVAKHLHNRLGKR